MEKKIIKINKIKQNNPYVFLRWKNSLLVYGNASGTRIAHARVLTWKKIRDRQKTVQ